MSFFRVESNDFGMSWRFWRISIFIEKWVLGGRFASNFTKKSKSFVFDQRFLHWG